MGINKDFDKSQSLERLFDLTKFGKGIVGRTKGYPDRPEDFNEKGRWAETIVEEFKCENTRKFSNDDGTTVLYVTLKVATPGHPAQFDACQLALRFNPEVLANPDMSKFAESSMYECFRDTMKFFKKMEIFPANKDWESYEAGVADLADNWDKLYSRTIKAGVRLSAKLVDGNISGPYANWQWWNTSDLDKKPEATNPEDLPF